LHTIVSCEPTFAENLPVIFPKSFLPEIRTLGKGVPDIPGPSTKRNLRLRVPRLNKITARLPSFNCFTQISLSPSFLTRRPACQRILVDRDNFLVRQNRLDLGVIDRKSFPRSAALQASPTN